MTKNSDTQTEVNQALATCLSGQMVMTSLNQQECPRLFERVTAVHQQVCYIDELPWYLTKGKKR